MNNIGDSNPLAEVALALAMGFFSIMVLAMVSMAAGPLTGPIKDAGAAHSPLAAELRMAEAKSDQPVAAIADQRIVIFHQGVYLNPDLTPFNPASVTSEPLVLAVDPQTSVSASMAARAGLGGGAVTMTVLDPAWMARLKGAEG